MQDVEIAAPGDPNPLQCELSRYGGGGDSGVIQRRRQATASVPEMYFFDITGVNPGDQF